MYGLDVTSSVLPLQGMVTMQWKREEPKLLRVLQKQQKQRNNRSSIISSANLGGSMSRLDLANELENQSKLMSSQVEVDKVTVRWVDLRAYLVESVVRFLQR